MKNEPMSRDEFVEFLETIRNQKPRFTPIYFSKKMYDLICERSPKMKDSPMIAHYP